MNQRELFGKRVRTMRRAARLTQEELAEAAHLNPKYLGQLERGEKSPSFEVLIELARNLRASPGLFFDFEREENDEKALRRKIDALMQNCGVPGLQLIHKLVKAISEP